MQSWFTAKVSICSVTERSSQLRSLLLNSKGSMGSTMGRPRYSSMRSAASIIAPMPDSYIWMVRLDTPAVSARVPRLMPRSSRAALSMSLSSLTYSPPGAANMNGGASSRRRSASVSFDMMEMLNLE